MRTKGFMNRLLDAHERKVKGLLQEATPEDRVMSLESSGTPTDHHRAVAARLFKVAYEDVTPEMRREAKKVSFYSTFL